MLISVVMVPSGPGVVAALALGAQASVVAMLPRAAVALPGQVEARRAVAELAIVVWSEVVVA